MAVLRGSPLITVIFPLAGAVEIQMVPNTPHLPTASSSLLQVEMLQYAPWSPFCLLKGNSDSHFLRRRNKKSPGIAASAIAATWQKASKWARIWNSNLLPFPLLQIQLPWAESRCTPKPFWNDLAEHAGRGWSEEAAPTRAADIEAIWHHSLCPMTQGNGLDRCLPTRLFNVCLNRGHFVTAPGSTCAPVGPGGTTVQNAHLSHTKQSS